MKITVWISGTVSDADLAASIRHYIDRLPKQWHTEIRIYTNLETVFSHENVVILDQRGVMQTSEGVAAYIENNLRMSIDISIVIGPADGIPSNLRTQAKQSWALSGCVLQHDVALLVLAEQLYRAHTIISGHPYHRA